EGSAEKKEKLIKFTEATLELKDGIDPLVEDTIKVIRLIKEIQSTESERAVQRVIISNCQKASDVLGLTQLFLWEGWTKKDLTMDFVPLYDTVDDFKHAADVIRSSYSNPEYSAHLKTRGNK